MPPAPALAGLAGPAPTPTVPVPARRPRAGSLATQRVVPVVVFSALSIPQLAAIVTLGSQAATQHHLAGSLAQLVSDSLYLGFVWLNVALFATRPPAAERDRSRGAWALAMLGTFGLVLAPLLPRGPAVFDLGGAGTAVRLSLAITSMALAIATLSVLGRSFGLTPEARRLVTRGPYRLVRHPLYCCETLNIIGLALFSGHAAALAASGLVIAAQVGRARREERLLSRAFPEYPAAFGGVAHFLPGIY